MTLRRPLSQRASLCLKLLLLGVFLALPLHAADNPPAIGAADSARYLDDVKALTAPSMEGRGDGGKGLIRAGDFIEKRFKSLGLEPAGAKGFFQPFVVTTGARLKSGNELRTPQENYKLHQDFIPFSFSSNGSVSAQVIFAGYGITAPEFSYDDYAGVDVKDKIVLVLRYEPSGFAAKSGHMGFTQHAQLITKAINARNHGAKALILVNGKLGDGEEDILPKFGSISGPEDAGIICLQAKNSVVEKWIPSGGKSLLELQNQVNEATKPASLALSESARISLRVNIEAVHATVRNVLAYLPGKTDEYVVVGAHYDHLGRGDAHSLAPSQIGQIHPGADDNASGAAGVLELARLFSPLKGKLDRGILFASFAGEELGLLGSAEWVKNPTHSLEKAVAMLNMDMIGRIKDEKVYVGGVGTGSTLKSLVEQASAANGSHFHLEYSEGGYSSSDHTSFVTKKIPVLFFFSGLHGDYHKPSDTWEKINPAAAAQLLDLVSRIAVEVADASARPSFVQVVENPRAGGVSGGAGGYGPYFGSIPDFGQTENGVRFSDVRPGSPAAKAGFQAGDVLIQFGDMPIKNLYDFTDALRRHKIGDVLDVTVLRDGKPIKASVKLEQRK